MNGYKAVVVNNWFPNHKVSYICQLAKMVLPSKFHKLVQGCPFVLGHYNSLGVEQFEIDPKSFEVKSVWHNSNVTCTSSIPVVSETDEQFYCIGNRPHEGFTLESLNWKTGAQLFTKALGKLSNPFYAGNEITDSGDFVIGTILGPIRV